MLVFDMPRKKQSELSEEQVVAQFCAIAFSPDAKDSDRLRALDWLGEYLEKNRDQMAVMRRLDEVLARMKE